MRRHLPLIVLIWGAAIVLYALVHGGSFIALLFGVAMVLAGGNEVAKKKRRPGSS